MNILAVGGTIAGWIALLALYMWRRWQVRKKEEEKIREELKPTHILMLGLSMIASYLTASLVMRLEDTFVLIFCFLFGGVVAWLVLRFFSALFTASMQDIFDDKRHQ